MRCAVLEAIKVKAGGKVLPAGSTIELDEDQATALIAAGLVAAAELDDQPKTEPEPEPQTAPKAKRTRKAR